MSIPRNLGNFADNVNTNGKVEVTGINATGTPSGSTALLGNGTWGTVTTAPAGSTGQVQYNNAGAFGAISSGTSGQVLTSAGSGSAPTWATPAPSAGTLTAVASGSLANGDKVVVNSNGTVSVISGSFSAATVGTNAQYSANYTGDWMAVAADVASGKVVFAYQGSTGAGGYAIAVVGTISGTSITFGTPVVVKSELSDNIDIAYVASVQKVIVLFQERSNVNSRAVLGTVSGTSISFSGSDNAYTTNTSLNKVVYDSVNDRVVIVYRDDSNGYGKAIAASVSTTAMTYGSVYTYNSNLTTGIGAAFDPVSAQVIFGYADNTSNGVIRTCAVSGTVLSFGTAVSYDNSGNSKCMGVAYCTTDNKSVVLYQRASDNYGLVKVVTVSGTSVSLGTGVVFQASGMNPYSNVVYDANINKPIIIDALSNVIVGTISGTSISYASPVSYAGAQQNLKTSATYSSAVGKVVLSSRITSLAGYYGTVVTGGTLTTNLTATNYIGISNAAYSNGATATIQTVGSIDDAQSGLTAGQAYYVNGLGALSTTPSSPSVFGGTAVSATNIIIKG